MIFPVSVSMSVFERTIEIYGETVRGIDRWIEHSTQGKTDSNGVVNHSEKEERKEGRKEGRKEVLLFVLTMHFIEYNPFDVTYGIRAPVQH